MKIQNVRIPTADPAAIFAGALSIWTACKNREERNPSINLSDTFHGIDELMRVAMAVATLFENWACRHVAFDELSEWWPYKLELEMGGTCLQLWELESLSNFDENDALRLAMQLRLPLQPEARKRIPLHIGAPNPAKHAAFCRIDIRMVREAADGSGVYPLSEDDDLTNPAFGVPFYGIYGVYASGMSEHIADRDTSRGAIDLVKNLIPNIPLP